MANKARKHDHDQVDRVEQADRAEPIAGSDQAEPMDRITRLGRISFAVGSVIFMVIGGLHLLTQFTTLSSLEVRDAYRAGGLIDVNGTAADGWDLFAGTSVLMGAAVVAVGALDLAGLFGRPAPLGPPKAMAAITIAMLVTIAVVGAVYLTAAQLVGGIVGIVLFGWPLLFGRAALGGRGVA